MHWPKFAAGDLIEPPSPFTGVWRVLWQKSGYVSCELVESQKRVGVTVRHGFSAWSIHLLPDVELGRIMERKRPA